MSLSAADFNYIRGLVNETTHNVLESTREYAVETRLQPLLEANKLTSLQALIATLRKGNNPDLKRLVVETLLNNETMFFRDMQPFEMLRTEIIPDLMNKQISEKTLTIWSAACSSGQEPYSIAMLINQHFPHLSNWKVRIVGSDVSKSVIDRAVAGRFRQIEVNRGLPAPYLVRYFERNGMMWDISREIRSMVEFTTVNLAERFPNTLPKFDLIFLRNALLYFDLETKRSILAQIEPLMKPTSYLFLGTAETTINLSDKFARRNEKIACYQLK